MSINSCDALRTVTQVRKIRPTRRSVSGIYAFRGESSIPFESTLERDFLIRADASPVVLAVVPQPAYVPFTAKNGRNYRCVPDFLVHYRLADRVWDVGLPPLLVEVKPRIELQKHWRDWKPKFKALRAYATSQGWNFRIYDESRIRDQVLANLRFLERYKRMTFPSEDVSLVLETLTAMGDAPFDYLVNRHFRGFEGRAVGVSLVWHLLAQGLAECDMTLPLSNWTFMWIPSHD